MKIPLSLRLKLNVPQKRKQLFPSLPKSRTEVSRALNLAQITLPLSQNLLPVPRVNTHAQAFRIIFHFFNPLIICYTQLLQAVLN